jgi:hypothetical protein
VEQPRARSGGTFGEGVGPIFLNQLRCGSNDTNLLECESGQPHGLVTCSHSLDVGVQCPGTYITAPECVCVCVCALSVMVNLVDRNECKETPNPCHVNANCTDIVESYFCNCSDGFTGDGVDSCTGESVISLVN